MAFVDAREFGAAGDGITDDHGALSSAITAAHAAGGGTVFLPAGVYALSQPLGSADSDTAGVCLLGDGERASTLLATGPHPPIAGLFTRCRFENLMVDAGGHGGPGMVLDLDKSYVRHCWVRRWTRTGISLNPTREGLLNWVDDTFVEQGAGTGIHSTFRFYDSWIVNNNVGSTGPNLSVESGPLRILANHFDGAPRHNIELRGNTSLTIVGNICEGAGHEAIIYTMPDWLDTDRPQVQIVANNITNGGKAEPGRYPAVGIYSRSASRRTGGFNITGNYVACTDEDAGWSHAVVAEHVDVLSITGNQWDNRGFTVAPVRVDGENVAVTGNTSGNLEGGDHRLVEDVDGPVTLTARTGDRVYFLRDGASVTLPSAAANSCRLTMKNLGASGVGVAAAPGGAIDRRASIRVAPGQTVEMISDGSTWWTL